MFRTILPVTLASPRGLHVHHNMYVVTEKYTKNSRSEVSGHFGPRSIGHFGPRSEMLRHFGPNFLGPKCPRSEVS